MVKLKMGEVDFGIQKFAVYNGWTQTSSIEFWQIWLLSSFQQAALVLNASRRFRYTLDLKKEEEKEIIRRKIRSHAQVIRVLCHLLTEILYSFFRPFHFLYSEFVFSRQHFFSKKLAKKISEVGPLPHIVILTFVLVPIFIETSYYYAISYHSILVQDSGKKGRWIMFSCHL